jgi:hypothetical protein
VSIGHHADGSLVRGWSVAGTGDFSGEGMSDILRRDTASGNTSIWFMNGLTVAQASSLGTIPTTFALQSLNAD